MKERAAELKAEARRAKGGGARAEGEKTVRSAIDAMSGQDRAIGERLHGIVTTHAPSLVPKTWYGMPAYANDDGKVVCFFQASGKFKTRYSTIGFTDLARLDDGGMWPTGFALKELTAREEARIVALLKQAIGGGL